MRKLKTDSGSDFLFEISSGTWSRNRSYQNSLHGLDGSQQHFRWFFNYLYREDLFFQKILEEISKPSTIFSSKTTVHYPHPPWTRFPATCDGETYYHITVIWNALHDISTIFSIAEGSSLHKIRFLPMKSLEKSKIFPMHQNSRLEGSNRNPKVIYRDG